MFAAIARAVFGTANDRSLKGYQRRVPQINALEPAMEALSDEALRGKTAEFRARLADGATLDELLPEAFAVVREAAKRTLGQRHCRTGQAPPPERREQHANSCQLLDAAPLHGSEPRDQATALILRRR